MTELPNFYDRTRRDYASRAMSKQITHAGWVVDEESTEVTEQLAAMSMDFVPRRARECADARLAIVGSSKLWPRHSAALFGGSPEEHQEKAEGMALGASLVPLWFISREMTDLVDIASATVPLDTLLDHTMLPEEGGLVFFQRPLIRFTDTEDNPKRTSYYFNAMMWYPAIVNASSPGTMFILFAHTRRTWGIIGDSFWLYGDRLDKPLRSTDGTFQTTTQRNDRQFAMALWLLATQEGLSERGEEHLDRSSKRRSERAKVPTGPVRILRLRSGHTGRSDGTPSTVEWTHRWIVRGHWRNQAYGPGRQQRRPVWIAPHIRGPEDKPLDTREGIRVL